MIINFHNKLSTSNSFKEILFLVEVGGISTFFSLFLYDKNSKRNYTAIYVQYYNGVRNNNILYTYYNGDKNIASTGFLHEFFLCVNKPGRLYT